MSEMPMFDDPIPTSNPAVEQPPKRKPRKPVKKRGRPPGSPNKSKTRSGAMRMTAAKKRRKLRVVRVNIDKDAVSGRRGRPAAIAEVTKLTAPEMEMVLGTLQALGGFDKEAKHRILNRVRALA